MMNDPVLKEAERFHDAGLSVVWTWGTRPPPGKSGKAPIENDWQKTRADWTHLKKTYRKGYGFGVLTGELSRLENGRYLAMIDVDMKSKNPRHRDEAMDEFRRLFGTTLEEKTLAVASPNGLRFLVSTKTPLTKKSLASGETTKVFLPTAPIGTKAKEKYIRDGVLTAEEIDEGWRIRAAWEIDLLGTGQQGVLPPSVHPDSGTEYVWMNGPDDYEIQPLTTKTLNSLDVNLITGGNLNSNRRGELPDNFTVVPYDLCDTRLDPRWAEMIETGAHMEDGEVGENGEIKRHPFVHQCTLALIRAGFSDDEITTIFTDPNNYLGEYCYLKRRTKKRKNAAQWFRQYTLRKAHLEINGDSEAFESVAADEETAPKLTAEDAAKQKAKLTNTNWKSLIKRKSPPKDAPAGVLGAVLPLLQNIVLILQNAVGEAVFRRDEFQIKDIYGVNAPWTDKKIGDSLTDDDVVHIKMWLSQHWDVEFSTKTIEESIVHIATKNGFHPIQQKLLALPAWDGVCRHDTGWEKYFRAVVTDENREYFAQTFRKFMVASVWRVFEPGTKFDWMLVLEGRSGKGKTLFGDILFGDQHYLDGMPSLKDKDAVVNMQGQLCAEFGELSAFRYADLETIKSFITRRIDKIRLPYGKLRVDMPRQIVFIGTTEFDNYLKADEENRRFMPIEVGMLDIKALRRDRDQLWAEALFYYQMCMEEHLYLSGEADAYVKGLRREKHQEDESSVMETKIRRFIMKIKEGKNESTIPFNLARFKIQELFEGGGVFESINLDNAKLQFAARALKRIGAEKLFIHGNRFWKIDIDNINY